MIDLQWIRANTELAKSRHNKRPNTSPEEIDQLIELDASRRSAQGKLDEAKTEANAAAQEVGKLFKSGQVEQAELLREKTKELKATISSLEQTMREANEALNAHWIQLPNLAFDEVPEGKSEEDNEEIRRSDRPCKEASTPHWDIAERLNLLRMDLGVKLTGSGFPVYVGEMARLQRSLVSYFLAEATKAGYAEFQVPHLVNEDSARATGQLPDKEAQMYEATLDGLYLIPTAEVPLTNLYRDALLSEQDLPLRLTGYTPCFRREAGSYGKEVRGLNRLHQFDKVEIVQIVPPSDSEAAHQAMVKHVETLLDSLEMPYRVLNLCAGDLGFAAGITYDFEIWSPGQSRWLEVSSVSNFGTFQTNRLRMRYRDHENNKIKPHTLNGSALAIPRIVSGLLEQGWDGEVVHLPKVLQVYMGTDRLTKQDVTL